MNTQQPIECDLNESADELFANDEWCAQVKLDGRRCVIFSDGGNLRAETRNGNAQALPAKVRALIPLGTFTLDGELVGDDFTAFDLVSIGGDDVRGLPFEERHRLLATLGVPMLEYVTGEAAKRDLCLSVKRSGGEGIVFKKLGDKYREGKTANQVKLKNWRSDTFEVLAVEDGEMVIGKHGRECHRTAGALAVGTLVEFSFLERTKAGKLRHPQFIGVRDDLQVA